MCWQVVLGLVGLDEVKHALVGAAPTAMETFAFFDALGLQASPVVSSCSEHICSPDQRNMWND